MGKALGNWLAANVFSVISLIIAASGLYAGYKVLAYQVEQNEKTSSAIISKIEHREKEDKIADIQAEHRFTVLEGKMDSISSKLDTVIRSQNASVTPPSRPYSDRWTLASKDQPDERR